MNNFFNMPHGERFNPANSAIRSNSSATKTSQYKYYSQNMLAKSRLTRRQLSMSRGKDNTSHLTNKLSKRVVS
jgi:hypothetical protein